ncbi:MAG: hypothetical protein HN919_17815 [Verrucomicrobia bacterium]|jgi:hypothetical protein|nr:hypothetical protein [Verrucomicrobiota bacterium]MBT7068157.1 hypothetical protein [Verrucomicrobiota bacterium]MBT7700413.1 hypothetical protein [Verrucomicrobiota bacterium]
MMHSTIHFSLGMLVGTALTCRPLLAAWKSGAHVAPLLRRWLVVAYGLGLYAIVPNLLRRAGIAHAVCEGWIMNIFLLSPMLNRLIQGGTISGPFIMSALVAAQYIILLQAVRRTARQALRPGGGRVTGPDTP